MYRVQLDQFEGPLDLLLFFIRRDELNIYDIPIARITREFLDYVHVIQSLDLEVASDFIYMAAYLLSIKAQMMLPQMPNEEGEIEDPRAELTAMLLEHKQFKEASGELAVMADKQSQHFPRLQYQSEKKLAEQNSDPGLDIALQDVTLWDLMVVYRKIMQNQPKVTVHEIKKITITIEEQIGVVKQWLERAERFPFSQFMQEYREKIVVVISFLAVLELARQQQISLFITDDQSDFYIVRRLDSEPDAPPEEISNYG